MNIETPQFVFLMMALSLVVVFLIRLFQKFFD